MSESSKAKAKLVLSPQAKAILLRMHEREQRMQAQEALEQQGDTNYLSTQDNNAIDKLAV